VSQVEFNINDYVWFKLTPHGAQVWQDYRNQWRDLGVNYDRELPLPDAEGYHHLQMWDWMRIFGEHLGNGFENCFETTVRLDAAKVFILESQEA